MKLIADLSILTVAAKLAAAATTEEHQVYSLLVLSADVEILSILASSWERRTTVTCAATVEKPGTTAVKAERFLGVLSALKGEASASLTASRSRLEISAGDFHVALPTVPPYELPAASELPQSIELDAQHFAALIHVTRHAVATSPDLHAMSGIGLAVRDGQLRAAASDNKRLAVVSVPCSGEIPDVVLSSSFAAHLADFCCEIGAGPVTFRASNRAAELHAGSIAMRSLLIDATFPDYRKVTDQATGPAVLVTVSRQQLIKRLERVATVAPKASRETLPVGVVVRDTSGEAGLDVWAKHEGHDAQASLQATVAPDRTASPPRSTGAPLHCWLEALKALSAKQVTLRLPENSSAPIALLQQEPNAAIYISPLFMRP